MQRRVDELRRNGAKASASAQKYVRTIDLGFLGARLQRRVCMRNSDAGVGVLGSVFGVCAFLGFLVFASHVLLGLYATNFITATAWEAARFSASHGATDESIAAARNKAVGRLYSYHNTTIDVSTTSDMVLVRISTDRPGILTQALPIARLDRIERVASTRIERERE